MSAVYGGIEAGGTKIVCAVGAGPDDIRDHAVIPTRHPDRTIADIVEFFTAARHNGVDLRGLGIGSFGPLDLDPQSPGYGSITTTTKPGWAGTGLTATLARALDLPTVIDTDVNAAAYGEYRWGAAVGLRSTVYLTVGTGIGGGAVIDGTPLRGMLHPEMGHLHLDRHPGDDFAGTCPFHGGCAEGLASGPAIAARTGRDAADLAEQLPQVRERQAWYLAQLVAAVTFILSPEQVILGGGVMGMPGLLDAVREQTARRLGGALAAPALTGPLDGYLVSPALAGRSGVLGAIAMAEDLLGAAAPAAAYTLT